jgi:hypothetical protein
MWGGAIGVSGFWGLWAPTLPIVVVVSDGVKAGPAGSLALQFSDLLPCASHPALVSISFSGKWGY